jgi:hypothetical protein
MISHLEFWETAPGVSAFLQPLTLHRTVVLYDRHGCGLSHRDRTDFTAEDDMQDIEAVVQAVGASKVDLFGHSWCKRAMSTGGRLLIVDELVTPGLRRKPDTFTADIMMLAVVSGRERTEDEFAALLSAAELRLVGTTPTTTPVWVLEGAHA